VISNPGSKNNPIIDVWKLPDNFNVSEFSQGFPS
jgi:hypothetical protein